MKRFAISSSVLRILNGQFQSRHFVDVLKVASEEEAIGKSLKWLKHNYPQDEGWNAHDVVAMEISEGL